MIRQKVLQTAPKPWGRVVAVDFRGHPMFPSTGFNTPTRFEVDLYDCEVWGKVPTDIEGNFYRMQCDFQYRPPQNEWPTGFNGDGHVSRFNFKDGNVNFRSRYVQTARLKAERTALPKIPSMDEQMAQMPIKAE